MQVTYELVRKVFDYNPATGELSFKPSHGRKARVRVSSGGYLRISWLGTQFLVHRVIWLWMTGSFPPSGFEVDHKDEDKANNRWNNLQLLTCLDNNQKKIQANSNNPLGIRGISQDGDKFRVRLFRDGKRVYSQTFDSFEEAVKARKAALEHFSKSPRI
jgi:hypothetical protein